ncbi:MAG: peptidoglycan DD-metalloendopeptidase family protein [Candidatus Omnitrophica bacterium]|nr:peptidoglycan DD-metalloendopeptidase family protein [Candidatus Omnitrophota bacterium]
MQKTTKHSGLCSIVAFAFIVTGCASSMRSGIVSPGIPGFYHQIIKGQTLYGISRMYDTDLHQLASLNRIADTNRIETGQLLFIPGMQKPKEPASSYTQEDFIWPLKGKVISSFGQLSDNIINKGINIQVPRETPVVAARSGRVIFSSDNFLSFGKTVIIEHSDGFLTVYSRITGITVQPGNTVRKGEAIARIGPRKGRDTAYLHFEVRKGYIPQNPYFFLPN